MIHRDLKPSNIVVTDDGNHEGQIKILDFGLARMTEGDMAATITTEIGTDADWMLRDSELESLRGDPEFESIVALAREGGS